MTSGAVPGSWVNDPSNPERGNMFDQMMQPNRAPPPPPAREVGDDQDVDGEELYERSHPNNKAVPGKKELIIIRVHNQLVPDFDAKQSTRAKLMVNCQKRCDTCNGGRCEPADFGCRIIADAPSIPDPNKDGERLGSTVMLTMRLCPNANCRHAYHHDPSDPAHITECFVCADRRNYEESFVRAHQSLGPQVTTYDKVTTSLLKLSSTDKI